jgi:hypothetical protein
MGAAGMLCAFKARKMLTNYELICYEKNETVGGESIPLIPLITIWIIC